MLRKCLNAAFAACILALLVKGPGHDPIGWLLNDAAMFTAGARANLAYLTWREQKETRKFYQSP